MSGALEIQIYGGETLSGEIPVQGSKNSFQKILATCVRYPGEFTLQNVPDIQDATWLLEQFEHIGGVVAQEDAALHVNSQGVTPRPIAPELTRRSRASFLFAGALLGRFGEVEIGFPGGDQIGPRPVNYNLAAFQAFGAQVTESDNMMRIIAEKLEGARFTFPEKTVGGTINAILAASGCEGDVELHNCAYDSDIEDTMSFINNLGGDVKLIDEANGIIHIGSGSPTSKLTFSLESDQHAAATHAIAGALAGEDVLLTNVNVAGVEPIWGWLRDVGVQVSYNTEERWVRISRGELRPHSEVVEGGLPPNLFTDWGPQLQVLLTQLPGGGTYHEQSFVNRFAHVPELAAMDAQATLRTTGTAIWTPGTEWSESIAYDECRYEGPTRLTGARVKANDIRNGAALILAGLIADGETVIEEAIHVQRGYEDLVATYEGLGANIRWKTAALASSS